ncbi:putative disease resistance protein At5g47280 [Cryptomeria japonica]|uniref:putative disease resistance protein At5g47280 n=1 Tax=Cryptomeria japonica TaxID=3369 RepID=UPI0027D9DACC|nr:putative disease resistance protein At5g47280 [Cryptomeria japonica]
MEDMIVRAVLGVGLPGYYKAGVYLYDVFSGSERNKFEETVARLLPIMKELSKSTSRAAQNFSLERFQQFHNNIVEGNWLVEECPRICICLRQFWVAYRVEKLQEYTNKFIQTDLPIIMAFKQDQEQISQSAQLEKLSRDMQTLIQLYDRNLGTLFEFATHLQGNSQSTQQETVTHGQNSQSTQLESVCGEKETLGRSGEQAQHTPISEEDESQPPDLSPYLLGFDDHIMQLKKFVLEERVDVVRITAMGGAGKSTLAAAICDENEIRDRYLHRVIYIVVSQNPHLLTILKSMWRDIVGGRAPNFRNVEDAHNKLQFQIKSTKNEPILVVVDDVWSRLDLEKLLFEAEQYTTIVTTRDKNVIPEGPKTRVYELPLLQEGHALSLFCYHAFKEPTIPIGRDKDLVIKVQQQCNGLPLALKVIGRSLYGKSDSDWKATSDALPRGESVDDNQINVLLNSLETSINALNPGEKQCFLDLTVFPKGRTIPANILLDIWVYVRRMRRNDAVLLLRKFAATHLLDLKKDPWTPGIADDCMDGYSFSQHDVMRELALFLAERENEIHSNRFYMSKRQSELLHEWQTDGDRLCRAQIVSSHTGAIKETQWSEMDFPVAEALILYFTESEYCIPTFLKTMKRLKVLIIHNDNSKRAKLSGLAGFQALSQLKTLYLERLIVPPLNEDCKGLKSLQKISLTLCELLGKDTIFNFPGVLEFNVSYCIDLEELPAGLYSSSSLEILSITNCHRLAKLPDEMGRFESLKQIRLFESPGLKALPSSICNLRRLKFLDISSCIGLKVNRWERCELKETLQTVAKLRSLKNVICDEKNEWLFKRTSRTDLKVEVFAEQEPNLDWLDLGI